MAGIRWTRGDLNSLRAAVETFGEKAALAAIEALEAAVEQGKRDVRARIIDAPPTARSVKRGHNARWETGAMYMDVDKDIHAHGTERVVGSFGWLHSGEGRDHAEQQDQVEGRPYEKVNALFPAHVAAVARFKQELAARGFKAQ